MQPGRLPLPGQRSTRLGKIFSDDFELEISHPERPYRWTKEHADALVEDLLAMVDDKPATPVAELSAYFLRAPSC